MYEYEINIDLNIPVDKNCCDEWGAAYMWLDKDQDAGVEYNLCYDGGECCSAIYKMEMNYNYRDYPDGYLETDYNTFEHYEIDFNDENWKEKLVEAMKETMEKFFDIKREDDNTEDRVIHERVGQYVNVYHEDGEFDVFLLLHELEESIDSDKIDKASEIVQRYVSKNNIEGIQHDEELMRLFPWGFEVK